MILGFEAYRAVRQQCSQSILCRLDFLDAAIGWRKVVRQLAVSACAGDSQIVGGSILKPNKVLERIVATLRPLKTGVGGHFQILRVGFYDNRISALEAKRKSVFRGAVLVKLESRSASGYPHPVVSPFAC